MNENPTRKTYPVLPLRDIVVFPHMVVPLFVGRERSIQALEEAMNSEKKHIILATQLHSTLDDPDKNDLYTTGTLSTILQLIKLPDGTVKLLVEGEKRVYLTHITEEHGYFQSTVEISPEEMAVQDIHVIEPLMRAVLDQFEVYVKLNRKITPDVLITAHQIDNPDKFADTIASYLILKVSEKQKILETALIDKRLETILGFIEAEIIVMQVEKKIRGRVKNQMEKNQKEYYLNEQLKAIQKELGETEDGRDEFSLLEEKIKKGKLSAEAKEKCESELRKLRGMNQMSAEATVIRNYLDWMLVLPWENNRGKVKRNLVQAKTLLDSQHYGLDKVKDRILEYLAVQIRVGKVKGQILCLVGPPGVGKTSLGKSIAQATGRQFVRISLGGVRDEAEIRGHRRTYIGSMPGKIIQGMRKAKTRNPLFLLDEIDKMGSDWRGDPASALLEVLDPEQNATFSDHYLEVDYDLSDVMFVTTANSLRMPQPLLDRMEIIRIPGYTEDEKVAIAMQYLIPKQFKVHGVKKKELSISEDTVQHLIREYTSEAGVRGLEREIANLSRKAIKEILIEKSSSIVVTPDTLSRYAGVKRYRYGLAEKVDSVGVTTGLAWTEVGGDLLSIEAVALMGKGKILMTGKLGEVMQESVQAAVSYVRSQSQAFGIPSELFETRDLHIHVPEGAIPKDGPSAGIAMCTSLVSALTGIPVHHEVAMTGEITLRGHVLPIGGLKEKLLAAHRGEIKTVLIPKQNEKDLEDIPQNIKEGLVILPVRTAQEVLKLALSRPLEPLPVEPPAGLSSLPSADPSLSLSHFSF